jgi:plasmid stabilization system protein ParE
MPPEHERRAKPLEWSHRAWDAYCATLEFISDEDPFTSQQVKDRVERALLQIRSFPGIGTPTPRRRIRRFPVPNTGHILTYRETRRSIVIVSWYRARQNVRG